VLRCAARVPSDAVAVLPRRSTASRASPLSSPPLAPLRSSCRSSSFGHQGLKVVANASSARSMEAPQRHSCLCRVRPLKAVQVVPERAASRSAVARSLELRHGSSQTLQPGRIVLDFSTLLEARARLEPRQLSACWPLLGDARLAVEPLHPAISLARAPLCSRHRRARLCTVLQRCSTPRSLLERRQGCIGLQRGKGMWV